MEFALDLVHRLHNEKSFDVALRASDQCNRMKLSDEIIIAKERKFPILPDDDSFDEFNHSGDEEDIHDDIESQRTNESRYVSPSNEKQQLPVNKRVRDPELGSNELLDSPPPRKALKLGTNTLKKRNPFAKKTIESPVRPTPSKTKKKIGVKAQASLSRLSTFSAQARQETKKGKTII